MLRVMQISFFVDPEQRPPEQLLDEWSSLVDIAEAAALGGAQVTVVQADAVTSRLVRHGLTYQFLRPERSLARDDGFLRVLREVEPDVFHVHGLGFPRDVRALAGAAPGVPIIVQDHADRPPRFWRRTVWRRGLACAAAVTFCSPDQALPFRQARLLQPDTLVCAVPESSSRFVPGDQQAARDLTQLHGRPCLLWVGHLDRNKSPLTVLRGLEMAVDQLPDLQVWICYATAPCLDEVTGFLRDRPRLAGHVHLLGRVPHDRVEQLMRAADFFVLGSRSEGSGYALIEALACGLPPVVTDIPSFRSLTGNGRAGRLWPCGDAGAFAGALVSAVADPGLTRQAIRAHFDAKLSLPALGRRWMEIYQAALRAPAMNVPAR